MKIIITSPKNRTVYNFRGDLIKELIALGNEVVVTGPNKDNVEKIEALGVRFVEIPVNKNSTNPINDLKYQNRLYKLFNEERPDMVFSYTSKPVVYGSIAAKKANVPHIVSMITGAGYTFTSQQKKAKAIRSILLILYKLAFNCCETVIFQNKDDMKEFIGLKLVEKDRCRLVNGSGVNMEKFHKLPFPQDVTFFMLSRVMYSKGIREYLEAASIVKKERPQAHFMLLGACENIQDSIGYEEIKKYVDDGILEYFGETEDVSSYYGKCSVYVCPSYREGVPRTVLEAMATARPIITTDAPGCRETVIDGKTGFIIPIKDAKALCEKMIWFIDNQAEIEPMGIESYNYCREKFEVSKVNKAMLEYLNI